MKRVRKFWSHEGTPTQLFEVSLFVVISVPVGVRIFSVVLLRTSCGVLSNTTYFRFTCFQFCYHTLLINVSVCTCRSRVGLVSVYGVASRMSERMSIESRIVLIHVEHHVRNSKIHNVW